MSTYDSKETANRIKFALNDVGISASELARITGLSKSTVSRYCTGSLMPTNITAGKMAKYLKSSPMWLMGFDVPRVMETPKSEPQLEKTIAELVNAYMSMYEGDQKTILELAKTLAEYNKATCRYPLEPSNTQE